MYDNYVFKDLNKSGAVSDFGWHLANFFFQKSKSKLLAYTILLFVMETERGNTCLDISDFHISMLEEPDIIDNIYFNNPNSIKQQLLKSGFVSEECKDKPFVIFDNLFTTSRFFKMEMSVLNKLNQMASRPVMQKSGSLSEILNKIHKNLNSHLAIITGGPGTGKTTLLSKVIAESLKNNLRIAVCAPTGKAVSRLTESISKHLKSPEESNQNLTIATIHGLLKYDIDGFNPRFDQNNPLKFEVIILDEASMTDLFMMENMLKAISDNTLLIMSGDRYQLASVGAGAAFSDICDIYRSNNNIFTELTDNYRFSKTSELYISSNAVKQGDIDTFYKSSEKEVKFIEIPQTQNVKTFYPHFRTYIETILDIVKNGSKQDDILDFFSKFQIISPFKKGRGGVEDINKYIENELKKSTNIIEEYKIFKKIIITENDYQNNIFNGETGFIKTENNSEYAFFKTSDGSIKKINKILLPRFETAHCITVHKSQGSEFDSVLFFGGTEINTVLSRELLYTAITRARKNITIIASKSAINHSIRNNAKRNTIMRPLHKQFASK